MSPTDQAKSTSVAVTIVRAGNPTEQALFKNWLEALLLIKASDMSRVKKIKAALNSTVESKAVWPLIKLMAAQVRKHGWDERGSRTRWATVASAVGIVFFGGQSAGIVALGGGIGVPLWVVFGGGAAFAKVLLDEISGSRSNQSHSEVAPTEHDLVDFIDGEFEEVTDASGKL